MRAIKFVKDTLVLIAVLIISLVVFAAYPLLAYFVQKKKMALQLILPLTDPETDFGFHINTMHCLVLSIIAAMTIIGIEIFSCVLINNLDTGVDIVKYSIEKFDVDLKRKAKKKQLEIRLKLRDILVRIQDLDR